MEDESSSEKQAGSLATDMVELRERFLYILDIWAADKLRYLWLEERTGISAARWQNVTLGKQFPTLEMLIAVCNNMPHYSYWLMLGKDPTTAPNSSLPHRSPTPEEWGEYTSHRDWIKKRKQRLKATE